MRTKFNVFLTLMLALVVQLSFAQGKVITGVVTEAGTGEPLPGVNVVVKGTDIGAATDFDGKYSIKADKGQTLVFSFVGYNTVEKKVGDSNVINVQLKEGDVLTAVEITAVGQIVKKENDLSSSSKVKAQLIERAGEQGVLQSLSGKSPGVYIVQNSGDPGAGAYIQIRGQNTILGDASPLIIVDGVPIANDNIGGGTDGVVQQSRLNDINPNDIKKIEVLKGASAAAIYGTGAANGVIVITTKDGSGGKKGVLNVNLRSQVSFDNVNIEHEKQDIYGQGYPTHWFRLPYDGKGIWYPNAFGSWGDKISERAGGEDDVMVGNERFVAEDGTVYYPINSKNSKEVYNSSNRDQVFRTGMVIANDVSLSYSNDKTSNFFSFSNWDQDGVIKGKSNFHKKTIRLNNTTKLTDKFTFKFRSTYSYNNSERIQQGSNLNGLYLGYLRTPPDFDNSDYLGVYYDASDVAHPQSHRSFRRYLGDVAPIYNNPGWTINMQRNPTTVNRFIITPELSYKVSEKLGVTVRYGLDYYSDRRQTFFPYNSAGDKSTGYYDDVTYHNKIQTFLAFANGSLNINDNIKVFYTLGTQFESQYFRSIGGTTTNFTNPYVTDLFIFGNAEASNESPRKYIQQTKKSAVYSTVSAELFDQLVVEVGGRYEQPSTVNEPVFYPTFSAGWKFSKQFFKDSDILSFGKLRFSYGEIGIEPAPYLNSTSFGAYSVSSSWGDYLDASQYGNPFARSSVLGNPNLTVETKKEYEIGVDLAFLKNRINFGATYYNNVNDNAILYLDLPASTGYNYYYDNAATISNKGFELELGGKIINKDNLKWEVNLNWSTNKNMVEDLAGVNHVFLNGFTGTSSEVVEGHPFGAIYGGRFLRDDNGDLVLDANGFPQADPVDGVIGDPNPDWIGGLASTLSYKGFKFNVVLATSQGNEMWGGTEAVLKFFGINPETAVESTANVDMVNYSGETIPAGTTFRGSIYDFGGGPVPLDVDWYTDLGGGFGAVSEQFIHDASWTKLREVSLYYTFSNKLLSKTFIKGLQIGVAGKNLYTWTKFVGVDPEINLTGASKGRGLDYFTNPGTKSVMFITNIKF